MNLRDGAPPHCKLAACPGSRTPAAPGVQCATCDDDDDESKPLDDSKTKTVNDLTGDPLQALKQVGVKIGMAVNSADETQLQQFFADACKNNQK